MTITHEELFEIAVAEFAAISNNAISPTVARTPGTKAYWLAHAIASAAEEVDHQAMARYLALYVDTAEGEDLDRLASDHFSIQRQGATAAVVTATFTRVDTSADLTIPAGTVITTPKGIRFSLDAALELPAATASASGTCTSVLAGRDQNAAAGTLTGFGSVAPASDMTVTNTAAAAGGNDAETDADLRQRIRERDSASPGTLAGIRRGALQDVAEVREAAAYEPLDSLGRQQGWAALVVADEDGNSNATLEASVTTAMGDWRGAGIYVDVFGATVDYQDIAIAVVWQPNQATPANRNAVRDAVVAFVNRLDPNGASTAADAPAQSILTPDLVSHAARTVSGVVDVTVTTPSGAVAPDRGRVIRTTSGRVAVT